MLNRIDLRGKVALPLASADVRQLAQLLPRAALDVEAAVSTVREICEDVRQRGAEAVREHTLRFDRIDLSTTVVPRHALADALAGLDPRVTAALREAARRVRLVAEAAVPSQSVTYVADGSSVTERYVPVGRAGVYVPGGLVAYPSSVVMNVVPAQAAGVGEIVVASPPQASSGGLPHVKAIGVELKERKLAQVSTNLTDFDETPIRRVFEAVRLEAERNGCSIHSSEIVGLVPRKALDPKDAADLLLENFAPAKKILENRLEIRINEEAPDGISLRSIGS